MSMPFEPWHEIICHSLEEAAVVILGVPFDGAVCARPGAAEAPAQIRKLSGLPTRFNEDGVEPKGFSIYDAGDISPLPGWDSCGDKERSEGAAKETEKCTQLQQYFAAVENRALELLKGGRFCLFLGGDHSVSIPLIKAFSRAHAGGKIGILHFDAHPDLVSEYDGLSWSHACTQRRSLELEGIKPEDLALLGVRSFMEEEAAFLASHPELTVFKVRDIYKKGPETIAKAVIDRFRDYDSLYMTIDIDVLDPAHAPGTGTPDAGGLSTRELLEMVRDIAGALPVKAADLVEVSPPLDTADITSLAAVKVIYELMAAVLLRDNGVEVKHDSAE